MLVRCVAGVWPDVCNLSERAVTDLCVLDHDLDGEAKEHGLHIHLPDFLRSDVHTTNAL